MSDERLCAAYADDWSALLDGELATERATLLEHHLADCELCSARVAALRAADVALRGDLPLPELTGDLRARLQERIAAEGVTSLEEVRQRRLRLAPVAGLLAAAAVAVYLAITRDAPLAPAGSVPELPIVQHETVPVPPEQDIAPEPEVLVAEEDPPVEAPGLDAASEEELALALELDTIEDLDVIENLDLIEALLLLEGGTG